MVYFFNLIFSLSYIFFIGQYLGKRHLKESAFLFIFLPLIIIWTAICGGQDAVGTDYPSYIRLFNGQELDRYEPLFVYIIQLANKLGLKGQSLYFIFYAIGFVFLFKIFKTIDQKYLFIFVLLYICYSGLFNNQLNILRQVIATYIGTYAIMLKLCGKKLSAICLICCASAIHYVAIGFMLFYLIRDKDYSKFTLWVILAISILLSIILSPTILTYVDFMIPNIYIKFFNAGSIEERSMLLKITKYIFIPFFALSLYSYKNLNLSNSENLLFAYGIIAFCLKLVLLNLTVISRVVDIYAIFTIFPLYYYFRNLYKTSYTKFLIGVSFMMSFYAAKVILFPSAEYSYKSIYYNLIF